MLHHTHPTLKFSTPRGSVLGWVPGWVEKRGARAPLARRPPWLCSALHRGDARSGPERKGRAPGPPLLGDRAEDPPWRWGAGEMQSVRGWERDEAFSRHQQKPQPIKRFPSRSSPPPEDTRYTTCQVRDGGVPRRRPRRAQGCSFPACPAPGTPQPRENRWARGGRESCGRGSASPDVRTAVGRSPAQERAQARAAQSRITRLRAHSAGGCSLGAPRISRRPPPGVFIQTPVAGEAEVAAAAAEEPSRIPGNVSAAPRPPHA